MSEKISGELWNRLTFASDEEYYFFHWIAEGMAAGIIADATYQPEPFRLSDRQSVTIDFPMKTKVKKIDKFLLHQHSYQADFRIIPLRPIAGLYPDEGPVWIDVKGGWMNRGSKQEFSINRKWVYDKHGVYINKVIPDRIFKETWCPNIYRWTPITGKPKIK